LGGFDGHAHFDVGLLVIDQLAARMNMANLLAVDRLLAVNQNALGNRHIRLRLVAGGTAIRT